MGHHIKKWLLIIIALILTACASPNLSQELARGKYLFESGNYRESFRELLPLAVANKCEAQYAVGYMYYNGYGVNQDDESGLFWMRRSAEQGYQPAINALTMIQHPRVVPRDDANPDVSALEMMTTADLPKVAQLPPSRPIVNVPMVTMPERPYPKTKSLAPPPLISSRKDKDNLVLKSLPREREPLQVAAAPPVERKFSLQLFGSYKLEEVNNLKQQLLTENDVKIWQTEYTGKPWYVLTVGKFQTVQEATEEKEKMAGRLAEYHPWVRNTSLLRSV